jgi:hypothetical protein
VETHTVFLTGPEMMIWLLAWTSFGGFVGWMTAKWWYTR